MSSTSVLHKLVPVSHYYPSVQLFIWDECGAFSLTFAASFALHLSPAIRSIVQTLPIQQESKLQQIHHAE
jgi:hypothetical protein